MGGDRNNPQVSELQRQNLSNAFGGNKTQEIKKIAEPSFPRPQGTWSQKPAAAGGLDPQQSPGGSGELTRTPEKPQLLGVLIITAGPQESCPGRLYPFPGPQVPYGARLSQEARAPMYMVSGALASLGFRVQGLGSRV